MNHWRFTSLLAQIAHNEKGGRVVRLAIVTHQNHDIVEIGQFRCLEWHQGTRLENPRTSVQVSAVRLKKLNRDHQKFVLTNLRALKTTVKTVEIVKTRRN